MSAEPISLGERLQFGLIAAALGAVVGVLSSLIFGGLSFVLFGHQRPFNNWWLIGFSPAFFFVVGVVRGVEAADTIANSFVAVFMLALGGMFRSGGLGDIGEGGRWKTSYWWVIFYLVGLFVVAWIG